CIDLVLNHTAKEHAWAEAARAGDPEKLAFYRTYEDRRMPDAFEETLLEVFPDTAPGNFTFYPDMGERGLWVWTTFNEHQWDLNWENPEVFLAIAETMLFLANKGAEVLRFDAVAFLWKALGTTCQNLAPVHDVLAALRACSRIAAAALIHKEEAIVAPRNLIPYLGVGEHAGREGNLAYHNTLMVQFWSMLASRDAGLATHVLDTHFPTRLQNAAWATYIRCHDDIGWAITEEDAEAVGLSGPDHRRFLADFYEGAFPGSFARGGLFQVNEETGDRRNNGATASLCGLEAAREAGDEAGIAAAIDRILLGHALIAAYGGIPLVYMGDEIGLTNDPSFSADLDKAHDTRWMHRPAMDWDRAASRHDPGTIEGRVFAGVAHILHRRKATPHLHADNPVEILRGAPESVLALRRESPLGSLIGLFNASDDWRHIPAGWLRDAARDPDLAAFDALSEAPVAMPHGTLDLPPRGRVWLV
ncbi:MAG: alpha-amylase family glycosyl hydrolase, partial [Pseudomonadota bacterium]